MKIKIIKKISNFDMERFKRPLILMALIFLMVMVLFVQSTNNEMKKETKQVAFSGNNIELEKKIKNLTDGYPIEKMASYISRKDEKTAAFLIAIAKKESDWGKHVPILNGEDCFNYWGYRGIRDRMGSEGHTCFESPRDAVNTISKRLSYLIQKNGLNTPKKMIIWKCGKDCGSQNQQEVEKWIEDVDLYYGKVID